MSDGHHANGDVRFPSVFALGATLCVVLVLLPLEASVLLLAVLTAVVGVVAYRLGNDLLAIFSIAFLVRLGFILLDVTFDILPAPPIANSHSHRALELSTAWLNGQFLGVIEGVTTMRVVMAYLLAPFYVVLGPSEASGRIAIALASLLAGYVLYRIARRVLDRRMSVLATTVVFFWPTFLYRSVVIQREVIGVLLLFAFIWAALQWLDRVTLLSVAVAIVATVVIYVFREENLFLFAVIVAAVSVAKSRERPAYLAGLVLLATPFLAYFALNFGDFTGHGVTLSPAAIDSFAHGRAHGDAAYLVGLHYDTWLDIVVTAPIKVAYFLFTPFPWQIRGGVEAIVGASAIGLLVATVLARRGIGMLRDEPEYLGVLLSYLLTGILAYSIIEMNYGAAVRRRIQFVPIIILLAVIGLSNVDIEVRWSES